MRLWRPSPQPAVSSTAVKHRKALLSDGQPSPTDSTVSRLPAAPVLGGVHVFTCSSPASGVAAPRSISTACWYDDTSSCAGDELSHAPLPRVAGKLLFSTRLPLLVVDGCVSVATTSPPARQLLTPTVGVAAGVAASDDVEVGVVPLARVLVLVRVAVGVKLGVSVDDRETLGDGDGGVYRHASV